MKSLFKYFFTVFLIFCFHLPSSANPKQVAASANTQSKQDSKPFFDFDITGSVGNYNGQSYTEVHVGVNMNFTDWLTWRNSAFKRVTSGSSSETTGLDSSLRFAYDMAGVSVYAGPGYRWADSSSKNALLGEAGASISLGSLSLGAGAKYLRYDQAQYSSAGQELKREDLSYFFTISGGTSLSF